jgi:hypothetical protein
MAAILHCSGRVTFDVDLSCRENLLRFRRNREDNEDFTVNPNKLNNRFIRSRWIPVAVVALFFLSEPWAKADPVGDFFKKVGHSISKAFQARPEEPQTRKTRPSPRSTSRESNAAETGRSAVQDPSKPAKEATFTRVVLPASAAPAEQTKGDMRYGIPVPGQKGLVMSPYSPEENYVDVSAFAPGSAVKDPYTGKIFLVP